MIISEIITSWIGTGSDADPFFPKICNDYNIFASEDVTAQPAENLPLDQNMYVIKVKVDNNVFSEIEADDNYFVLWSEEIVNE